MKVIKVTVDNELYKQINILAKENNEPMTELLRRAVRSYLEIDNAKNSLGLIEATVEQAVRNTMNPYEERMAKIAAKNALQAGMARFMNEEVMIAANYDIKKYRVEARKRAVAALQSDFGSLIKDEE